MHTFEYTADTIRKMQQIELDMLKELDRNGRIEKRRNLYDR